MGKIEIVAGNFIGFEKTLRQVAESVISSMTAIGRMFYSELALTEATFATLRVLGWSDDEINRLDLLCRRLGYGTGNSYFWWLERASTYYDTHVPERILDALFDELPQHVRWQRMEWESFGEWRDYIFERGLIDEPDARWAYQVEIMLFPIRWAGSRIKRIGAVLSRN